MSVIEVKGRLPRPEWDEYFLAIAKVVATRSTCLRVPEGVGAVLVEDKQILSTGYAGSIRGLPHCTDEGCLIDEKTGGCVRTVHAEANAILQAAQHGVSIGVATIYTTMSPCLDCMKLLLNGGIKRIAYTMEYRTAEAQRAFAAKIGVPFEQIAVNGLYSKYVPVKPQIKTEGV